MNGTAFGFSSYPQRPSVSPKAVGVLLMQRQAQGGGGMAGPGMPGQAPPQAQPTSQLLGATQDQFPIGGPDSDANSLMAAAREAMRRGPQGQAQQRTPATPFNSDQLLRMGVSPDELRLLQMTGAIK